MLIRLMADDLPVSFTMSGSSPDERIEPITLDNTKSALRFLQTAEDILIAAWMQAARQYFESQTGRQCIDATYEYGIECAPTRRYIELPRPPLASVTSIMYTDGNGDEQTFDASNYRVVPSFLDPGDDPAAIDPHCAPGRIELVNGAAWPITNGASRSMRIRRVCGYGATSDAMPGLLQAALYMLVGHYFRNRNEVLTGAREGAIQLPLGAQTIIDSFKYTALVVSQPLGVPLCPR